MKPNPGGVLTGEAIIGREQEVEKIWRALENQSVVLTSERRVGKTCVLRKLFDHPKNDWAPILYFVESKRHPVEFIEGLYESLLSHGMIESKLIKVRRLYSKYVGGEQIGSWRLPDIKKNWKELFETLIEDIVDANKKVLLMFDELPVMISHIIKDHGSNVGMEFLDTLRLIRNKYEASKKIAFIFCGSIGIELVIKDLKRNHGYNSDPINNMKKISLDSLNENDALLLCEKLSENEKYVFEDKNKIFSLICDKTDKLPFYIQLTFEYFCEQNEENISFVMVDKAINNLLDDPDDEGFFGHSVDRIKTYYDMDYQIPALLILDKLCKESQYLPENEILDIIESKMEGIDTETFKEVINLLWSDHYLIRKIKNEKRLYKFKYSILQNWWKINRG